MGAIETDPVAVRAAEGVLFEPVTRVPDQEGPQVEAAGEVESAPPEEKEMSAPIDSESDGPVGSGAAAELVEAEAGKHCTGGAFTQEAYLARLNDLEEKQRAALARAMGQEDDKQRDRMQRELVIMNDKLALLDDSYAEEVACYQEVLQTMAQLDGHRLLWTGGCHGYLAGGGSEKAEEFLAWLSEQEHPLGARAGFHSGQLAECRVDLQTALDRYRRAVEREPENALYLQAAGRTARSLYRYKEALPWFESFVRLCRENKKAEPLTLAMAQRELAYTYMLSGQYQKAGPLYKEAMSVMAKKLGQEHPEMATCWYQIGEFQETMGEYDKAVTLYRKALAILERTKGMAHPALAVLSTNWRPVHGVGDGKRGGSRL
jgi:tetratricopeptide (TPR) repeat protein